MADRYRLVMAISLLLWVVSALVISTVVSIWLYGAAAVARRWDTAARSVFASLAAGARIVLLIAFYRLSSIRASWMLTSIVLSSTSCASILLLVLVFCATLRIGASWICILVCIATAALLCRLIMTMLAILIQTVVVLVTLILTRLLAAVLSCRIVLRAPDIASSGWRIAFVLRVHILRLEYLFRGLSRWFGVVSIWQSCSSFDKAC